jgi:hypothetical protein
MSLPKSNGRDVCPRRDNKKPRAQARSQMISRDDTMGDMDVVVGVTDRLSHVSSFPSGRITILLFPTQRNTNQNIMAVCVCGWSLFHFALCDFFDAVNRSIMQS